MGGARFSWLLLLLMMESALYYPLTMMYYARGQWRQYKFIFRGEIDGGAESPSVRHQGGAKRRSPRGGERPFPVWGRSGSYAAENFWNFTCNLNISALRPIANSVGLKFWRDEEILSPQYFYWGRANSMHCQARGKVPLWWSNVQQAEHTTL